MNRSPEGKLQINYVDQNERGDQVMVNILGNADSMGLQLIKLLRKQLSNVVEFVI